MNTLSTNLVNMNLSKSKVNLNNDLPYKKQFTTNSWFAVSHFENDGERLSFLYHTMIFSFPGRPAMCTSCISFTNESTGEYIQDSRTFKLADIEVAEDKLNLSTPISSFKGDINKMTLFADCGNIKMNIELVPMNYPLLNGGTGCFNMLDMDIYQYSLPTLETTGTLNVKGKEYKLNCMTWLDRQWQINKSPNMTWGWMDFNLSTGEYISLWFPVDKNIEKPFATVLYPDGTQKVVKVDPIIETARNFWKSDVYIYDYPTEWTVSIPELNTRLKVKSTPKNQELRFKDVPPLNHYEAASTVSGIFQGKVTDGHCYVELLALMPWSKVQKNLKRGYIHRTLSSQRYKIRSVIGMMFKR